ncbi:MAG: class II aldolase/adducin family protein [Gammaproteobacteria bacterium]|nr:class II aldolase/adducin family protein [Gammaproteobacteria bacterium]
MLVDGVIKYQLDYEPSDPVAADLVAEINAWRNVLYRLDLVGHYKTVYQGVGYGNLSCRLDDSNEFVITASQTGHIPKTDHTHYSHVTESSPQKNYLAAKGPMRPSSEALSHAAVYQALPNIRYVFHVHNSIIWQKAAKLNISITAPEIEYGTVAMAAEIERLCRTVALIHGGIIAMGGHQDGIVAFAATAAEAGSLLVKTLVAAELES